MITIGVFRSWACIIRVLVIQCLIWIWDTKPARIWTRISGTKSVYANHWATMVFVLRNRCHCYIAGSSCSCKQDFLISRCLKSKLVWISQTLNNCSISKKIDFQTHFWFEYVWNPNLLFRFLTLLCNLCNPDNFVHISDTLYVRKPNTQYFGFYTSWFQTW